MARLLYFVTLPAVALAHLSARGVTSDPAAFAASSFDYIVIGGGSGGLTLASRLSDDPSVKVGVIEAGLHLANDPNILVPGYFGRSLGNPTYDWGFNTKAQAGLSGRNIYIPRGRVLGGTSAINFLAYNHATNAEYDGWAELGNSGWNSQVLKAYLKKTETYTPAAPNIDPVAVPYAVDDANSHGTKGPINVTYPTWYTELTTHWFKTLDTLGLAPNLEVSSGKKTTGTWLLQSSLHPVRRERSYTTNAYFEPRSSRSNLVVLTGAHATKINLSSALSGTFKATGVTFVVAGQNYTVAAKREVILAAGAIQTPQLLELSGIGGRARLSALGIPVKIDNPNVGENYQDHSSVPTNFKLKPGFTTLDNLSDPAFAAAQWDLYVQNRTGIFSAGPSTVGQMAYQHYISPSKFATLKAQLTAEINAVTDPGRKAQLQLQQKWNEDTNIPQMELFFFPTLSSTTTTPQPGSNYLAIILLPMHPVARGSIHINSTNPLVPPVIDPNYLSSTFDLKVLVEAVRHALKIATTEPMASAIDTIIEPSLQATDAQLETYIRNVLSTANHPIGTASLLPRDKGGVVDRSLRVYGTTNLRIVDASIFPTHLAANPTATIYAIAELAADMIAMTRMLNP